MSHQSLSNLLNNGLTLVNQQLSTFTLDPNFNQKLTLAFGNSINPSTYKSLWSSSDFDVQSVVDIKILTQAELNGAIGAYSRDTNEIYLADSFLTANANNLDAIALLLLEEYGHFIDAEVNPVETRGDEGRILALYVQGENISPEELQALQTEDDTATLTIDGQTIAKFIF